MQCFIYKSLIKSELYLYLNKKEDFSKLPDTLLKSLGRLEFVMELKLTPERKLAKEDVNKVINCLSEKGFFIQIPPTILPNSLTLKNNKLH